MKIWFPTNLAESEKETISDYVMHCRIYLCQFKMILRNNIISPKWDVIDSKLSESDILQNKTSRFKARYIPYQYADCLDCFYDSGCSRCYYDISDFVKCYGTTNNLKYIIKLVEYGNDTIPPLNWVRHSYIMFKDVVVGGAKR